MAKYLWQVSYTSEGLQGVLKDGGTGRRAAIEELVKSVGGTVECVYYAFGSDDAFIIADLPDHTAAAAAGLTVNATGLATVRTVVLLTPEEVDAAARTSVQYRPPGR